MHPGARTAGMQGGPGFHCRLMARCLRARLETVSLPFPLVRAISLPTWDPRSNKLAFLLVVAGAPRRAPGIASRYDRQNAQLITARAALSA
jgi:hypothetical protein